MADDHPISSGEGGPGSFEDSNVSQQRFVLWHLCVAGIVASLGFVVFFAVYAPVHTRLAIIVCAVSAVLYFLPVVGPLRMRPRIGGPLFIAIMVVEASFGLAFFGTGSGIHLLYLIVAALSPRLMATENRTVIIAMFVLAGVLLVSGIVAFPPERALIPVPANVLAGIQVAFGTITLVVIGAFALWAREHTDFLERRLRRSNRNLRDLVRSDALTGLLNRRGLLDVLGHEWARGRRDGSPLAVLMIDIDHFKPYNDHYGHPAGDVCLERFARVLESAVHRPADVAARYGGEEFTVVLPDTDREGAAQVADRVLERLAGERIPHGCPPAGACLTASIGACAMVPDADNNPDMLIFCSDQALYRAKQAGRNRLEMD